MKTSLLFIFFFLGFCIISCVDDELENINGKCGYIPPHFEILGLESSNMRFTNFGSNPWETLEENESVNWSVFFVRFGFNVNYIASQNNYGVFLMALSCVDYGYNGDKIGIDTIIVKTVSDYNLKYKAGSVINEIVVTNEWTYRTDDFEKFEPITDYLSENSKGIKNQTFELKLTEEPETIGSFSFDITYKLNNGEEFQHRSEPVNLTK